ncbi:MAG: DNA polymerase III subunit delta [Dehalococcoidales bacterium]|nr:DNA polymerase III subunit delta [Dehalococcoidales bacterium]
MDVNHEKEEDLLYILSGQDDFSLNESLEGIKRGIGSEALLTANTTVIDGQQITAEQLRNVIDTAPFLADKRLVIIKGLLERFVPKGKPGRQKKATPSVKQQDEQGSLLGLLSSIPASTILALVDVIDDKTRNKSPLFKELSAGAEVRTFPLLKGTGLRQWIREQAGKEGAEISPPAVELLARLIGSNLWIMQNEIRKLALFTSGRCIEEDDVSRVASHAQEASVFAMVDAVIEFKTGLAEGLLEQLLENGAAPTHLLFMISRQFRMIARVKELKKQGGADREIQTKLGIASDFAFRKTVEQSNRYPLGRIKEVYHRLLATDLAIKTGKYHDELALNILVAELCQQPQR